MKSTLKYSTSIQVSSSFIQGELIRYFPEELRNKRIVVIPEGVDTKYFMPSNERHTCKHLAVLYPASFLEHKNHQYLVKALELLPKELSISVKFTGEPNRYIDILLEKTTELVRSRIILTGQLSDSELLAEYQQCDVVISCSKYESSSLPILEGLSCGAMALASDIPAHREMAKDLPITLFGLENPELLSILLIQRLRERISRFEQLPINEFLAGRDWSEIGSRYLDYFEESLRENFK